MLLLKIATASCWWRLNCLQATPGDYFSVRGATASPGCSGSGLSALGLGRHGLAGLTSTPVALSLVSLPRLGILEGPRTHTLGAGPTSSVWGPGPSPSLAPSSPHPRLPLSARKPGLPQLSLRFTPDVGMVPGCSAQPGAVAASEVTAQGVFSVGGATRVVDVSPPPTLGSARYPPSGLTSCAGVQGSCSSPGTHGPPGLLPSPLPPRMPVFLHLFS